MATISVIVPIYNAEKYLHRCVDSLLAQSFQDFELILVDDGSSDSSPQICDAYAATDTRIKAFHQKNQGVSSARNFGLDMATGRFCTFIDSDDWVAADFFSTAIDTLLSSRSDIYFAGHYRVVNGKIIGEINIPYRILISSDELRDEHIVQLLEKNYIASCCGKVYSREIIGDTRFPVEMNFGEDLCFVFMLLQKKATIIAVPNAYYYYCTEQGKSTSLTRSISEKHCQSTVKTYLFLFDLSDQLNLGSKYGVFVRNRWCSDLLYIEEKILNSRNTIIEKYRLLRILLGNKQLQEVIRIQEDKYLRRYAANPLILLAHRMYNNAKTSFYKNWRKNDS